jgi:hypothetical protein
VRAEAGLAVEGEAATAAVAAVIVAAAEANGAEEALDRLGTIAFELG